MGRVRGVFACLALFGKGRHLWIALGLALAMMAVCFRWWYAAADTHVLNQVEPVWVTVPNTVPSLGAIAMICCCAPRVPLADRLGTGRPALYGTVAVVVVCAVAMSAMPVVYAVYDIIPRSWIPGMDAVDATGAMEFGEYDMFGSGVAAMRAVQAGFFCAVATAAVALAGRVAGVVLSLAVMAGELVLGSTEVNVELSTFTCTAASLPAWGAVVGVMLAVAWTVWYLTAAGAPLQRPWRYGEE